MKTLRLLIAALRDLLIQKGFIRPKKPERAFAFIVHPRDASDAIRKYPFAKFLPSHLIEFWAWHFWPVIGSRITGLKDRQGKEISGWVVICPLMARQLVEHRSEGKRRILASVRLAEALGARIVGLGALTSSITNGGLDIAGETSAIFATGRTMTALVIRNYILYLLNRFGESLAKRSIAIVGAGGSVGATTTYLLAKEGARNFLLVDLERKSERVERIIKELVDAHENLVIKKSHHIGDIKDTDIIVTATNAPEALVTSDDIRPGTIIVDDAQPSDVHPDVMKRDDVLVVSGGVVKTPNIFSHFRFGLAEREENFSCLAEVMLLASSEQKHNFALGRITESQIHLAEQLAQQAGYALAKLQNSLRVYTDADIERVAILRQKNRDN